MPTDGRNSENKGSEKGRMAKIAVSFSAVGLEMGIAVTLGYFVGNWLDGRYGTKPWLMIVGLFLGLGAAAKAVVNAVNRAKKQNLV